MATFNKAELEKGREGEREREPFATKVQTRLPGTLGEMSTIIRNSMDEPSPKKKTLSRLMRFTHRNIDTKSIHILTPESWMLC